MGLQYGGAAYGAAIYRGCMQSGGTHSSSCARGQTWGCGTVELHAGLRYMEAACGAAARDVRMRGSCTWEPDAGLQYSGAACGAAVHEGRMRRSSKWGQNAYRGA